MNPSDPSRIRRIMERMVLQLALALAVALISLSGLQHAVAQVSFAPAKNYVVGPQTEGVVGADVNGDGKMDLIGVTVNTGALTVLTNNGTGGFGSNGAYSVGFITLVVAADVNGDGKIDLIAADKNG